MGKGTYLYFNFAFSFADGLNCFLDFCDLHTSSLALNTLNNSQMGNFKLRVDYAKKKMGDGMDILYVSVLGLIFRNAVRTATNKYERFVDGDNKQQYFWLIARLDFED